MMTEFLKECANLPPPWLCSREFFKRAAALVEQADGKVAPAAAEFLKQAGVTVSIEGYADALRSKDRGLFMVGDHHDGIEPLPQSGALGQNGWESIHFFTNPLSVQARMGRALGDIAAGSIIPVIPASITREKRLLSLDRHMPWRIKHRKILPTVEEKESTNSRSGRTCVRLLAAHKAVAIYPAAGVKDATKTPWYPGAGGIIRLLSRIAPEEVDIVPLRFDRIPRLRFLGAVCLNEDNLLRPTPPQLTLRVGKPLTVDQLLYASSCEFETNEPDNRQVTETLRRHYIAEFSGATA